jgi:hypothetical protein
MFARELHGVIMTNRAPRIGVGTACDCLQAAGLPELTNVVTLNELLGSMRPRHKAIGTS